ncbi:MAG: hypothetical protein QXK06_02030 [Candidatus Diapherotrites archaeon]
MPIVKKLKFLFLTAIFLAFLPTVFGDCLVLDQQVKSGDKIKTDCLKLTGANTELFKNDSELYCIGSSVYFATTVLNPATGNIVQAYNCQCEDKQVHHPWFVRSEISMPVFSKKKVCPGEKITVSVAPFTIQCIDGALSSFSPAFLVGYEFEGKPQIIGHNCNHLSSNGCNLVPHSQGGQSITITIPQNLSSEKKIRLFTAMQAKYDYQITANSMSLPIVHWQTIELESDNYFDFATDKLTYCRDDAVLVTGESVCCGSVGSTVEIVLKDSSGKKVKTVSVQIKADNSFSATIPLNNNPAGQYIVSAKSTEGGCSAERPINVIEYSSSILSNNFSFAPNSPVTISGSTECCAKPSQKANIKLLDTTKNVISSESAVIKNNGSFEATMLVPGKAGEYFVVVDFPNPVPECTGKSLKVSVYDPYIITSVEAENREEGQKARVRVSCNKEMPVLLKLFSEPVGKSEELLAEQNYQCNTGFVEIGPELSSGIYRVVAISKIATCEKCEGIKRFVVSKGVVLDVPDFSLFLLGLIPLSILFLTKKREK